MANPEIGDAFQENVSRGFDDIVDSSLRGGGRGTLLNWVNSLDRHLERLLTTTERGPTLKFVQNAGTEAAGKDLANNLGTLALSSESTPKTVKPAETRPTHTAEEIGQAEKRRAVETKQLEARLGRLPLFQKADDSLSFIIPIQPTKLDRLPIALRPVKTVKLSVPLLYPLEPSSIELQGVHGNESLAVEIGFSNWFKDHSQMNLVSQVNYLASNIHNFAKTEVESELEQPEPGSPKAAVTEKPQPAGIADLELDEDKPHLHIVQRPPEWTVGEDAGDSDETEISTSEEEFSEDGEDGGAPVPSAPEPATEQGIALSFPFLELYGIELLELVGLYITIKCDRCKELLDVKNVPQTKDSSGVLSPKVESCKKCSNSMSIGTMHLLLCQWLTMIGFRRLLMHTHSNRAGYLDLDGCTVADLLPR